MVSSIVEIRAFLAIVNLSIISLDEFVAVKPARSIDVCKAKRAS
jgi:hypothetical protein